MLLIIILKSLKDSLSYWKWLFGGFGRGKTVWKYNSLIIGIQNYNLCVKDLLSVNVLNLFEVSYRVYEEGLECSWLKSFFSNGDVSLVIV